MVQVRLSCENDLVYTKEYEHFILEHIKHLRKIFLKYRRLCLCLSLIQVLSVEFHSTCMYRIRPNFRGAQFSRIALSKHFAETIFADQGFRVIRV